MKFCGICKRASAELYPIDDHLVCELCLMQGRLDEMPDYASIESHELELVAAAPTLSSWWNRDISAHPVR